MEGQVNSQQHGNVRHTSPPQPNPAAAAVAPVGGLSEGLDVFDLQLRKDCANVPNSFMGCLNVNAAGPSPSPTVTLSAVMFSSVATATHGLASTMSNPQTTRCMVRDVAQVILRYISAHGEPQPEKLSDDFERQLILQFVDELQRSTGVPPMGVVGGGDGRWTIDKEVVLSLKNGREGLPPPGAEVPRPHHPYVGYCGPTNISPRLTTQPLWRGTPPTIAGAAHGINNGATNNNGNGYNARSGYLPVEGPNPTVVGGMTATHHASLTAMTLNKRVGNGDVIRPQPQHPRSGPKGIVDHRHVMTSTKKVLRSASSAFSECSAGETGEVSSSMSRTTVCTNTLMK